MPKSPIFKLPLRQMKKFPDFKSRCNTWRSSERERGGRERGESEGKKKKKLEMFDFRSLKQKSLSKEHECTSALKGLEWASAKLALRADAAVSCEFQTEPFGHYAIRPKRFTPREPTSSLFHKQKQQNCELVASRVLDRKVDFQFETHLWHFQKVSEDILSSWQILWFWKDLHPRNSP